MRELRDMLDTGEASRALEKAALEKRIKDLVEERDVLKERNAGLEIEQEDKEELIDILKLKSECQGIWYETLEQEDRVKAGRIAELEEEANMIRKKDAEKLRKLATELEHEGTSSSGAGLKK